MQQDIQKEKKNRMLQVFLGQNTFGTGKYFCELQQDQIAAESGHDCTCW